MYKAMQYYWHAGLLLGLVATMFLALAFRCWLQKFNNLII
jgi:hypothetical protein